MHMPITIEFVFFRMHYFFVALVAILTKGHGLQDHFTFVTINV